VRQDVGKGRARLHQALGQPVHQHVTLVAEHQATGIVEHRQAELGLVEGLEQLVAVRLRPPIPTAIDPYGTDAQAQNGDRCRAEIGGKSKGKQRRRLPKIRTAERLEHRNVCR
jgi:hypothetical protein